MRTMRRAFATCLLGALSVTAARAEAQVLYANGFNPNAGPTQYQGIWDQAGVGIGGSNVSTLQPTSGTFGFSASIGSNNVVADNFTVGAGETWVISAIWLYAYQTSAISFPFTSANVSVTGADPNGAAIFSETGASVAQGAGGIVARRATSGALGSDNRQIREIVITLASSWTLGAGDYSLRWALGAPNNTFVAPIVPTNGGGNARQSVGGASFNLLADGGTGANVELPFALIGSTSASTTVPEPSTFVLVGLIGLVGAPVALRRRLRGGQVTANSSEATV